MEFVSYFQKVNRLLLYILHFRTYSLVARLNQFFFSRLTMP
jgi:hypothetical protein